MVTQFELQTLVDFQASVRAIAARCETVRQQIAGRISEGEELEPGPLGVEVIEGKAAA